MSDRRQKIRGQLKKEGLAALLVTNFTNVTYLTGFTGDDSFLLISADGDVLISDQRYATQIEQECPGLEAAIRGPGSKMIEWTVQTLEKAHLSRIGFEGDSMTVAMRDELASAMPRAQFVAASGWVEELRLVKDSEEIQRTRRACNLARRAFEVILARITPEMTELQVANDLEYHARQFGATRLSFPPIVAVGPRAALPHARPTDRRIGESDFTLIDWGVNEGLYVSDLTRVLATARISPKLRKLYGVVLKAQLAGIEAIRPGVSCEQVDRAARAVIEKAGYGQQFGHGLGHGIGLEVHEAPRLAQGQQRVLKPGMIVTVEPGVYFPEWGGIRIEDDVLVTRAGHEVLTSVPKELDDCFVG